MGHWRDNGEKQYYDTTSLLKRMRTWLVWVGGWEHPWVRPASPRDQGEHGSNAVISGTYFSTRYPDGTRAGPTPISLFGHRITFYGWGWQVNFWRHPYQYFVWSGYRKGQPARIYISHDGTPPRPNERGIRIWPRANYHWN